MALGLKVSPDVSASFTGLYLVGLLGGEICLENKRPARVLVNYDDLG